MAMVDKLLARINKLSFKAWHSYPSFSEDILREVYWKVDMFTEAAAKRNKIRSFSQNVETERQKKLQNQDKQNSI